MALQYSVALRNAMLDQITAQAGSSALLCLYAGTVPASCATSESGTLLGTLTCGTTFATAATGGTLTVNTVTDDSAADASGTATHFRIYQSDGTTCVLQGTVGATGDTADMILPTTTVTAGITISCTSAVLTAAGA